MEASEAGIRVAKAARASKVTATKAFFAVVKALPLAARPPKHLRAGGLSYTCNNGHRSPSLALNTSILMITILNNRTKRNLFEANLVAIQHFVRSPVVVRGFVLFALLE